jgi:hypothetical protein
MPSIPYPLGTGKEWEEIVPVINTMFRELYENRCGGALVGDVFQIGGDTLELKLKDGSGLIKTNGELDIDIDTIGTNGAVMKAHYNAKGTLITATADSVIATLPVGSNTNVLRANSGVANGIAWGAVNASEVVNTPAGGVAATDVQAAITELDTEKQATGAKDAASGYAGLNASSRTTKGVDTTDDIIVDLATKGLVLKDTQVTPHYWRLTVTTLGVLTTTDLGTGKP